MNEAATRRVTKGHRPALLLAASLLAGSPASAEEQLAPGVWLLPGSFVAGSQPDGNSIVLQGDDGLVVVDSGRHAAHTARIVAHARDAGLGVRVVVNTHWHLDHVGGNPTLRREFPGVRVVATGAIRDARTGFLARYRTQLDTMLAQAANAEAGQPFRDELAILDAGKALEPDDVVNGFGRRDLAGRALELHLEPHAVTAGDLWLLDLATGTLIAGDLVTLPAPFLDTACPEGWRSALGQLAAADFTTLVPGHGPPMDRAAFSRYRAAFDGLLACAASEASTADCSAGWLAAAGALIPEADYQLAGEMVDYYVGEVLRGEPGRRAALCGAPGWEG